MYKHIFLNPFYWFAFIWGSILALYPLGWAEKYPSLTPGIGLFFAAILAASLVLGYFFSKKLKSIDLPYQRPRFVPIFAVLIAIGFLMDFAWAGHVPLLDELIDTGRTYVDFDTMPIVHMVVFTFAFFYGIYMFYCFVNEKSIKHRLIYLGAFVSTLFWYICLYNRSVLMMMGFMCVAILLASVKRIRFWHIATAGVVALVALYLFGVLGNIRSGATNFNDTNYLIAVAGINMDKVPAFLPRPFLWAYCYLVTPLGNLIHYTKNFTPEYSFLGYISRLIPDSIAMRLFPSYTSDIPLVIHLLTTASAFAEMYKYAGYVGMVGAFVYMSALVFILMNAAKRSAKYLVSVLALLSCMVSFLFFDNFLNYTGVILAFFYPVLAIIWEWMDTRRLKKELALGNIVLDTTTGETTIEKTTEEENLSMKTCLVLMCTYNGETYLREQIDSVLAQQGVDVYIKVADDRSSDGTVSILEEYAKKYPERFSFAVNEVNKRFTYNFLDLFFSAKDDAYDYYAFCDQDDVWLPNKISAAIEKIEQRGETPRGTLYCSNLTVVDENLEKTGMQESEEMIHRVTRRTVLFENIATGCTIVMNHRFCEHAWSYYPEGILLHDYWLFLIAVFTADAIYDPNAYILYRQHGTNQIGTNKRKWTFANMKKIIKEKPKQEFLYRELLTGYREFISDEDAKDMECIRDYRKKIGARWKLFFSRRYHKRNNNLILKFKVIFRKL